MSLNHLTQGIEDDKLVKPLNFYASCVRSDELIFNPPGGSPDIGDILTATDAVGTVKWQPSPPKSYGTIRFGSNIIQTFIDTMGVPVIINAPYALGPKTDDFGISLQSLQYTGAATKIFKVDLHISVLKAISGQVKLSLFIAKNGTVDGDSVMTGNINAADDPYQVNTSLVVSLNTNDTVAAFIQNDTATDNFIVQNLIFIATEL